MDKKKTIKKTDLTDRLGSIKKQEAYYRLQSQRVKAESLARYYMGKADGLQLAAFILENIV